MKIEINDGSCTCEGCEKEVKFSFSTAEPVMLKIGDKTICLCEECLSELKDQINYYLGEDE